MMTWDRGINARREPLAGLPRETAKHELWANSGKQRTMPSHGLAGTKAHRAQGAGKIWDGREKGHKVGQGTRVRHQKKNTGLGI